MPAAARPSLFAQLVLGVAGASALFIGFTLPPGTAQLAAGPADPRVVFGAYHIHTNRSDGTSSPDEIAAAAARAGLQFVILTDHGDGTRPPDPPQYRHGVLCIDAVEVGSAAGHVIALGLDRPAPYPLGGEASDVIDDLHRLGAWVVIAHPDSPEEKLRWRNFNVAYEGIEWLNLDSEWRDETKTHLIGSLLRYPIRPAQTIASLIHRPAQTLRRWDMIGRGRLVIGLAAVDAHARVPWPNRRDPDQARTLAKLPSYTQMFRTVAQAALLERPLAGNGPADAGLVLAALKAGRTYSAISAFATPASLTFTATRAETTVSMGESAGPVGATASFRAQVNDRAARVVLLHNGADVRAGYGQVELTTALTGGPYRIEAYRPGMTVPWIVSNPIYGGDWRGGGSSAPLGPGRGRGPSTSLGPGGAEPPAPLRLVPLPASAGWTLEKNATSTGTARVDTGETRFDFTLGGGDAFDQFAALVSAIDQPQAQEGFDRVQFTIRADRPIRLSVQLRLPGRGDQRWRYSLYADQTPRAVVAHLQDFQPVDRVTTHRPVVAHLRSVLFVVDTLNTRPSTTGTIWLSDAALGVGQTER